MAALRVLAVAVGTGTVSYVFFVGERLKDWGLSDKAARSTKQAQAYVQKLIAFLEPDVVVTEKLAKHCRKGSNTKALIAAIARVGADAVGTLDVEVSRLQHFPNKYVEAASLAEAFPELKAWVPRKPRLWESAPRNVLLFEALGLAVGVREEASGVFLKV